MIARMVAAISNVCCVPCGLGPDPDSDVAMLNRDRVLAAIAKQEARRNEERARQLRSSPFLFMAS